MGITGVKIGGADMKEKYGVILCTAKIGEPSAQTHLISVPLRDGSIDCTEYLTDDVKYKDRKLELTFLYLGDLFEATMTQVGKDLNGKKLQIIFDNDAAFYYLGRVTISSRTKNKHGGKFVLSVTADPFKYDVSSSAVDWEWDTFDFDSSIINEAGSINITGTTEFTLICRKKRVFPTFTVSSDMTLAYDGETYTLKTGSQKVYCLFLVEGENKLSFTGEGTLSIDYVGGEI